MNRINIQSVKLVQHIRKCSSKVTIVVNKAYLHVQNLIICDFKNSLNSIISISHLEIMQGITIF